ncbi:MAG: peptide-methionine (S)-S-oxide reductase MsrA [Hyphomicrobiales bacterium]|nr:peptide-methionine (S)-S-oxide reductase MsrA [Hyphomicrobiales bacterium]
MSKALFAKMMLTSCLMFTTSVKAETKTAIFAGGCFWCMEKDFEHVPGVVKAESGYTGGTTENPTYRTYEKGSHIEAIRIIYDSDKVNYTQLLHTFWRSVNPTDAGGQFCDRGHAYSTAIFTLNENQKDIATKSKETLVAKNPLPKPIVTPILDATKFWLAEKYHQDYYKKASIRYKFYRLSCGRDKTIKALWGNQAHAGIIY